MDISAPGTVKLQKKRAGVTVELHAAVLAELERGFRPAALVTKLLKFFHFNPELEMDIPAPKPVVPTTAKVNPCNEIKRKTGPTRMQDGKKKRSGSSGNREVRLRSKWRTVDDGDQEKDAYSANQSSIL